MFARGQTKRQVVNIGVLRDVYIYLCVNLSLIRKLCKLFDDVRLLGGVLAGLSSSRRTGQRKGVMWSTGVRKFRVGCSGRMSSPSFTLVFPGIRCMRVVLPLHWLCKGVARTLLFGLSFAPSTSFPALVLDLGFPRNHPGPDALLGSPLSHHKPTSLPPPPLSSLLRVGGRCNTERLKPFTLRELAQARKGRKSATRGYWHERESISVATTLFSSVLWRSPVFLSLLPFQGKGYRSGKPTATTSVL